MKVCFIGALHGNIDEGMKKVSSSISTYSSSKVQATSLNPRDAMTPGFWRSIIRSKPDVAHFITGPSVMTFVIMRAISILCPGVKTVVSTPYPEITEASESIVRVLPPDLVLAQSQATCQRFKGLGMPTILFPLSGVDVKRFAPVSPDVKIALREKYGIPKDKFIVLHVGHLREGRNVPVLGELQEMEGVQTVLVCSTSTGVDERLGERLLDKGCIILSEFYPDIQELYQLADCYVFPTLNENNCIQMPLSIMEAMACDLPVVSTKYGAIPDIFAADESLVFVNDLSEFAPFVERFRSAKAIKNREKVMPFSWEAIVERLLTVYSDCINGECPDERAEQPSSFI